jgi:hypothetical protein
MWKRAPEKRCPHTAVAIVPGRMWKSCMGLWVVLSSVLGRVDAQQCNVLSKLYGTCTIGACFGTCVSNTGDTLGIAATPALVSPSGASVNLPQVYASRAGQVQPDGVSWTTGPQHLYVAGHSYQTSLVLSNGPWSATTAPGGSLAFNATDLSSRGAPFVPGDWFLCESNGCCWLTSTNNTCVVNGATTGSVRLAVWTDTTNACGGETGTHLLLEASETSGTGQVRVCLFTDASPDVYYGYVRGLQNSGTVSETFTVSVV